MEPILFPNAEAVIATLLRAETGERVENQIPNPRVGTFYVVRRVGGPRAHMVADAPSLAIEGWDVTDENAHDLAATARAHVLAATGRVIDGVAIYRVDEIAGLANLPDPLSDHHRHTFTVSVHMRGQVLAS